MSFLICTTHTFLSEGLSLRVILAQELSPDFVTALHWNMAVLGLHAYISSNWLSSPSSPWLLARV